MSGLKRNRVSGTDGVMLATSPMYNTCPAMMTGDIRMLTEQTMYGQLTPFGINCIGAVLPEKEQLAPKVGIVSGSADGFDSPGVEIVSGARGMYHPGYSVEGMSHSLTGYEGVDGQLVGSINSSNIPDYGNAPRLDIALSSFDGLTGTVNQQGTIPESHKLPDVSHPLPTRGGLINSTTHIRPKYTTKRVSNPPKQLL